MYIWNAFIVLLDLIILYMLIGNVIESMMIYLENRCRNESTVDSLESSIPHTSTEIFTMDRIIKLAKNTDGSRSLCKIGLRI